jgi:hypothetical protein
MKSPSSMTNGRFHTPKCRGKFQKMGVLKHTPPRSPGPCYMQGPIKKYKKGGHQVFFLNAKKLQVRGASAVYIDCTSAANGRSLVVACRRSQSLARRPLVTRCRTIGSCRPGDREPTNGRRPLQRGSPFLYPPYPLLPTSCPQIFAHVVNSSLLAAAHSRPAQTFPKILKHP